MYQYYDVYRSEYFNNIMENGIKNKFILGKNVFKTTHVGNAGKKSMCEFQTFFAPK